MFKFINQYGYLVAVIEEKDGTYEVTVPDAGLWFVGVQSDQLFKYLLAAMTTGVGPGIDP